MTMRFRTAVVGAGKIAVKSHIPVLRGIKRVEVVAICDKKVDVAKAAASEFNVRGVYSDVDEMLSREKPDIVDICTPPFTHAGLVTKSMDAGCHVLVEKPMAINPQDADAIILASKKNHVRLGVIHQNLFNPAVVKAKELISSGAMGDLLHVELRISESVDSEFCTDKDHWCHKLPGGIFCEIMPHPVYLSQFFLDHPKPVAVIGRKLSDRPFMKNDEVRVLLEGKNGLGAIIASCNSQVYEDTLDIFGSKLVLHADLGARSVILYKPHARSAMSFGMSNLRLSSQLLRVLGTTASTFVKVARGKASAHYSCINQFIQSLASNTEFTITAEQARATVNLLDQICREIDDSALLYSNSHARE